MRKCIWQLGLCLALVCLGQVPAFADGRPLIWNVSRFGDNSLGLRTGIRMPVTFQPGLGVQADIIATGKGEITAVPVSVWGSMTLSAATSPAALDNSQINFSLDAATSRTSVSYSDKQAWIASGYMDFVSKRTVNLQSAPGTTGTVFASQSVKLVFPTISAAVSAAVSAASYQAGIQESLTFEKQMAPRLKLTAKLTDDDDRPVANINLAYATRW